MIRGKSHSKYGNEGRGCSLGVMAYFGGGYSTVAISDYKLLTWDMLLKYIL